MHCVYILTIFWKFTSESCNIVQSSPSLELSKRIIEIHLCILSSFLNDCFNVLLHWLSLAFWVIVSVPGTLSSTGCQFVWLSISTVVLHVLCSYHLENPSFSCWKIINCFPHPNNLYTIYLVWISFFMILLHCVCSVTILNGNIIFTEVSVWNFGIFLRNIDSINYSDNKKWQL